MPAVSLYLYNLTLDEEGVSNNRTGQYIDEDVGPDSQVRRSREICRCGCSWTI